MKNAVMISIKPEYVRLIANGEKTIEIRKTKPNLEAPFKVYMYQTRPKSKKDCIEGESYGMVVGEFTCTRIQRSFDASGGLVDVVDLKMSCLSPKQIINYADGKALYYWYISDVFMYLKPRKISEYFYPSDKYCEDQLCGCCPKYETPSYEYGEVERDCYWEKPLERPPQSWCYVQDFNENKFVELRTYPDRDDKKYKLFAVPRFWLTRTLERMDELNNRQGVDLDNFIENYVYAETEAIYEMAKSSYLVEYEREE